MFRRVLIANRGEIASRVVRACRKLEIESVVVHSEADRDAPWLAEADRTICVGPAAAAQSYLDAGAILQAAEQLDCQAIHPGYGFLSENALFAARCEQQGLTFVGPPASAIQRMGDKVVAKRTMRDLGLPTIPGSDGSLDDVDHGRRLAEEIGYPVLLKAAAGGGGKGMRRCDDADQLELGFAEAAREAGAAFGNAALYLEKLIVGGRHIEFQVLCDGFGQSVHLGERECSIQRSHQKLVEESPSPVLDAATSHAMGERVARAVARTGYRSAGTVEFLRDADGQLYFMEMNARLQVEHPVTEMVTDTDLVAEQFRIAANQPLRWTQQELQRRGHAIEFRINAEDPFDGFRPDPGTIEAVECPAERIGGARVRWDSAIRAGYRVPTHYDSLLGKLIVHADTREAALEGASAALSALVIRGVRTTTPLHLRLLAEAAFREGHYDVDYLGRSGLLDAQAPA